VTAVQRCGPGERLIAWSRAVGLHTRREPTRAQLAAVRTALSQHSGRILVRARLGLALAGVRAQLQVHAVCTRGVSLP